MYDTQKGRELAEVATGGEWDVSEPPYEPNYITADEDCIGRMSFRDDAVFTTHMRNNWMAIMDEMDRLRAENEDITATARQNYAKFVRQQERADEFEKENAALRARLEAAEAAAREMVAYRHLPDVVGGPLIYPTHEAYNRLCDVAGVAHNYNPDTFEHDLEWHGEKGEQS
jgi:hypothetical protein